MFSQWEFVRMINMIQLHKYLLSSCYVLGTVLGAAETEMSKTWPPIKASATRYRSQLCKQIKRGGTSVIRACPWRNENKEKGAFPCLGGEEVTRQAFLREVTLELNSEGFFGPVWGGANSREGWTGISKCVRSRGSVLRGVLLRHRV